MAELRYLTLSNFRNYEHLKWSPNTQKIVLWGANGSGKTNLLEALSLLVPGRGLRRSRMEELARTNSSGIWGVMGKFSQNNGDIMEIATGNIPDKSRRQFLFDGKKIKNQNEVASHLSAIWLTPQMDRLFSEGAIGRRRFLDRLIITTETYYTREVSAYEKAMSQRNRLLTLPSSDATWLDAIEESMARHAVAISAARLSFVNRLNHNPAMKSEFPQAFLELSCPIVEKLKSQPALMVEDLLRQQWKSDRVKDSERGITSVGIHRSDVLFMDYKTRKPAYLASTGQQKALLIGIILQLTYLLSQQHLNQPMLLLDEPLVHLDQTYRKILLRTLQDLDSLIIITGTDYDLFHPWHDQVEFLQIYDGRLI